MAAAYDDPSLGLQLLKVTCVDEIRTLRELALSIMSQDPLWRLATFLSRRRAWRAELEKSLSLAVQLERVRGKPTPETGYVELWMRT